MSQVPAATCTASNNTCLVPGYPQSKAFGDYQYFLSFGGDQYLDIPLAIDAAYGTRGLIVQCGHFVSQVSYEVTGYTALGENFYLKNIRWESKLLKNLLKHLLPFSFRVYVQHFLQVHDCRQWCQKISGHICWSNCFCRKLYANLPQRPFFALNQDWTRSLCSLDQGEDLVPAPLLHVHPLQADHFQRAVLAPASVASHLWKWLRPDGPLNLLRGLQNQ